MDFLTRKTIELFDDESTAKAHLTNFAKNVKKEKIGRIYFLRNIHSMSIQGGPKKVAPILIGYGSRTVEAKMMKKPPY